MPSDFIPLLPTVPAPDRTSPAMSPPDGTRTGAAEFSPLVASDAAPPARASRPEPSSNPAHERLPVVTLKRDGDRVTRIQVRCSCGETVELDCAY